MIEFINVGFMNLFFSPNCCAVESMLDMLIISKGKQKFENLVPFIYVFL